MSRLKTCGFESGARLDTRSGRIDPQAAGTSPAILTLDAFARSGDLSGRCSSVSSAAAFWQIDQTVIASRTYFFRTWVYAEDAPLTASPRVIDWGNLELRAVSGNWRLANAGVAIGADGPAIPLDQWFKLEIRIVLNGSAVITDVEVRVNDVAIFSVSGQTITSGSTLLLGPSDTWSAVATTITWYFDDIAINDNQGATFNSWAGDGKIVQLDPIADVSREAWQGGAGGTTNLFEALNNKPPVGVVPGSATNTSQVENAAVGGFPEDLTIQLEAYTAAGITALDTILWLELFADQAETAATGTKVGTLELSDPVLASGNFNYGGGPPNTWPSTWTLARIAGESPPASLAAPNAVLGYESFSGTSGVECCRIGLTVEYLLAADFQPQVISYLS